MGHAITCYNYAGWAVLEWECALKHAVDGAAEGAPFTRDRIIRVTDHAFDDLPGQDSKKPSNFRALIGTIRTLDRVANLALLES